MHIESSETPQPQCKPSVMNSCYPTKAWSNVPASQHVSEEVEFWNTYMLVDCGDDVCAVPIEYDDVDELQMLEGKFSSS